MAVMTLNGSVSNPYDDSIQYSPVTRQYLLGGQVLPQTGVINSSNTSIYVELDSLRKANALHGHTIMQQRSEIEALKKALEGFVGVTI